MMKQKSFGLFIFRFFIQLVLRVIYDVLDFIQGFFYDPTKNPCLKGNFAPIHKECTSFNLPVTYGSVPSGIAGEFVRNGPNPVQMAKGGYHWFDGDGMLHGVRISKEGKISYINRQTKTKLLLEETKAEHPLRLRIGEMHGKVGVLKALLQQFKNKFGYSSDLGGTANTALVFHNNKLQALVESNVPYEIRLFNDGQFETAAEIDYSGKIEKFTAHPKVDPVTNEMFFFSYSYQKPYLTYGYVDRLGNLVRQFTIDTPVPTMMHDFAITERFAIFLDLSLVFSMKGIISGKSLAFDPKHQARVGILDRYAKNSDGIVWFSVPPAVAYHTVNAWEEEGDQIVLHLCRSAIMGSYKRGQRFCMSEWRFNMKTMEFKDTMIAPEMGTEFPTINRSFTGRKHKFAYTSITDSVNNMNYIGLAKFDLEAKTLLNNFIYGDGKTGGEGVFVPKTNAISEDEGYLLTFVHDNQNNKSSFYVVDALSMLVTAIVDLPQRVPNGFHGLFVSEEEIQSQLQKSSGSSS